MSPTGPVLAIDIGGTKLAAALVGVDGSIERHRDVPTTPTEAGAEEALWWVLVDLLEDVRDGRALAGVGVGCGGPMRWPAGVVSPLNIPAWRDFPLRARLAARYPDGPVRVANDAIAMAVGEHWQGHAADVPSLLGVVVSTGVGGGVLIDGRVVQGATGNAGHLGHVVVDPSGPACACGGRGCLEAIARGPAIVAWATEQGWAPAAGRPADGRSLLAAADRGDEVAVRAFARAGNALGVALASAAHLLELDVVVVGGGLANAGDQLLEPAREAFAKHARMAFAARCRIEGTTLGARAGLLGAAALVACGDRYWPSGAD